MAAVRNAIKIELDASGAQTAYWDCTSRMRSWTYALKRQRPGTDRFAPSTATIVLDNSDGALNVATGKVAIGHYVRLTMVHSTGAQPVMFVGTIDSVAMSVEPGAESTVTVTAVHVSKRSRDRFMESLPDNSTIAQQFATHTVATAETINVAAVTTGDPVPSVPFSLIYLYGQTTWEEVFAPIAEATGALLIEVPDYASGFDFAYVSRQGRCDAAKFQTPLKVGDSPTSTPVIDAELDIEPFEVVVDSDEATSLVRIGVQATVQATGTEQFAQDLTGTKALYGQQEFTRESEFSTAQNLAYAKDWLERLRQARPRVEAVTLPAYELLNGASDPISTNVTGSAFVSRLLRLRYRNPWDTATVVEQWYFPEGRELSGDATGRIRATLYLGPVWRDGIAMYDITGLGFDQAPYA